MGGGGCRGHGPGWGAENTHGWALMTEQERTEHHDRMHGMKSRDECKAYMDQHREQMMERAKDRGVNPPAAPRRDACRWFKR
jgi:hypothetical protein